MLTMLVLLKNRCAKWFKSHNFNKGLRKSRRKLISRCELPIDDPVATIASLVCLCLALTGVAGSLRVFGNERVVFWRESSGGTSTLAYFLAKGEKFRDEALMIYRSCTSGKYGHMSIDFLDIVSWEWWIGNKMLMQIARHQYFVSYPSFLNFTSFYSLTVPRAHFITMLAVLLLVQFTSTGIGYLVSIVVQPHVAQLTGVVVVLICVMFSGARPTLPQMKTMPFPMPYVPYSTHLSKRHSSRNLNNFKFWYVVVSYMRWAEEAIYISEISRYTAVYDVQSGLDLFGYSLQNFQEDMLMILALGVVFRIIAFVLLELLNRDKRK